MNRLSSSAVALGIAFANCASLGQTDPIVFPAVGLPSEGGHWRETSIAVSRVNQEKVVVACINYAASPQPRIGWAVTTTGFLGATPFANRGYYEIVPGLCGLPKGEVIDPTVVTDHVSGFFWIGGMPPFIARMAPNQVAFESPTSLVCRQVCTFDKPLLAVGPGQSGNGVAMYLGWEEWATPNGSGGWDCAPPLPNPPLNRLWIKGASAATPAELTLSAADPDFRVAPEIPIPGCMDLEHCEYWGRAIYPLVLPTSGRLLVAASDTRPRLAHAPHIPNGPWHRNNGLPWVVSSDDGGQIWTAPVLLGTNLDPPASWNDESAEGSWPALASHPTDGNIVYAVFPGFAPAPPTANVDVYIARSDNGGATFPALQTLRLSDDMLHGVQGISGWPNQVRPAVAVDGCGGVNLLFYDNINDPNMGMASPRLIDAYYVRITNFENPSLRRIFKKRLTTEAFPQTGLGVGDYIQIAASQHRVYPAYVARLSISDDWGPQVLMVNRIIVCPADVSTDGAIDTADVAAFGSAYVTAAPQADVNGDGTVDCMDVIDFQAAYTCGCHPCPPQYS